MSLNADLIKATWPQDWGRLLRLARQVAGLSLGELSAHTGLSKGYLSKLESGHITAQNPSRATLAALARALPSFRPLANTLEPGAALAALDFAVEQPVPAQRTGMRPDEDPVRLGWKELELLVALFALDSAALPIPLTSVALARAVDRDHGETLATLGRLVTMGVVEREWPQLLGATMSFRPTVRASALTGLGRVGDALVLGASLLAQAPGRPRRTQTDED